MKSCHLRVIFPGRASRLSFLYGASCSGGRATRQSNVVSGSMLAFTRNPADRLSSNPIRRLFSRSFFLPPAPAAVVRLIAIAAIVWASTADTPAAVFPKLDPLLSNVALLGQSNVVVMAADSAAVDGVAQLIQ